MVRSSVESLMHRLTQRGVVASHREHTPGSFVVTLAPVRELWDSAKRGRAPDVPPLPDPPSLDVLDGDTRTLLRQLAERSLEQLGVRAERDRFVESEMLRQFSAIAASLATGAQREDRLRAAIQRALEQYD